MDDVMGYGPEAYSGEIATHGTEERPVAGTVNIGRGERTASMVAGGLLALFGLTRRSLIGKALFAAGGAALLARGRSGHSTLYERMGVTSADLEEGAGVTVERAVTVRRPVHDVYSYWRDLEHLPNFFRFLEAVFVLGDDISHWDVSGPRDVRAEWDAKLIEDRPDELLSWRTLEGADIEHAGSVRFREAPGGRGTEVRVRLRFRPAKGGAASFAAARALSALVEAEIGDDLGRFRQLLETGEVPTTEGQPAGERAGSRAYVPEPV